MATLPSAGSAMLFLLMPDLTASAICCARKPVQTVAHLVMAVVAPVARGGTVFSAGAALHGAVHVLRWQCQ